MPSHECLQDGWSEFERNHRAVRSLLCAGCSIPWETPTSCPEGLDLGALGCPQSQCSSPQRVGGCGQAVGQSSLTTQFFLVVLQSWPHGWASSLPNPLVSHIHTHTHPATEHGQPHERAPGWIDEKLVLHSFGGRSAPACPGPLKAFTCSFMAEKCVFAGGGKYREARV